MAIVRRAKRETPFVQMDKTPLQDKNLSWKAKGVLAYLLSLPDDWQVYLSEITEHATDGKDSTRTAFNELIKSGYISREPARKKKGKFSGYNYTVSDYPQRLNRNGKPDVGKSDTTNKYNTNNNLTNKANSTELTGDLFFKIEGLKEKIGPNHYKLLNDTCNSNEETYQRLRGMYQDGRFTQLMDWLEYKKESQKGYKATAKSALTRLVNKLADYTPREVKAGVDNSISSGYSGLIINSLPDSKPGGRVRNLYQRKKANVI